jgi:F0F1-type ATP synthase assembly protein I
MYTTDGKENTRPMEGDRVWWRPAVALFSEVSALIFVPVILALVIGKYLDGRFDTEPNALLISVAVAFAVSIAGIVKAVRKHTNRLNKNNKNGNTGK